MPTGFHLDVPVNVDAAAVAAFPELRRLIDLREAGWSLVPSVIDGCVTEVRGLRTWPGGWADVIRVRYTTDTAALRCDHGGSVTWKCEGGLAEVVDGLMTLPVPGDRLAPRLVVSRTLRRPPTEAPRPPTR